MKSKQSLQKKPDKPDTQGNSQATDQLNVRLPVELLEDISSISGILHVQKSEWIKQQLAADVMKAKLQILEDASRLRQAGVLSEEEFKSFVAKR
jgi:hypothetical protein